MDSTPDTHFFVLTETGHGRVETRALATCATDRMETDGMYMDFPYGRSIMVVHSERQIK